MRRSNRLICSRPCNNYGQTGISGCLSPALCRRRGWILALIRSGGQAGANDIRCNDAYHFGGFNSDDFSRSLTYGAASSWRTLRREHFVHGPGGSDLASLRG